MQKLDFFGKTYSNEKENGILLLFGHIIKKYTTTAASDCTETKKNVRKQQIIKPFYNY